MLSLSLSLSLAAPVAAGGGASGPGMLMPDGTYYAGNINGSEVYAMPEDAPTQLTNADAVTYCNDLDAHGYTDWRLPTLDEIDVVAYQLGYQQGLIPGISEGDIYRSSTVNGIHTSAIYSDLGKANAFQNHNNATSRVRAVRTGVAP